MLESELFALLENTSDAAFTVNAEGELCSWNQSAETLFGFSRKDAIRRNCCDVLAGVGSLGTKVCDGGCTRILREGDHSECPNFDLNVKTGSGERIWISVSTILYENQRTGRALLVHLAHDISARKRVEKLTERVWEFASKLCKEDRNVARPGPVSHLSEREKQILRLFAQGQASSHVAKTLNITTQTLRNHLHHINRKLRCRNRLEAVTHAMKRRLI